MNTLNHVQLCKRQHDISERANVGIKSELDAGADLDQDGTRAMRARNRIER
jgi:hypothetical protein